MVCIYKQFFCLDYICLDTSLWPQGNLGLTGMLPRPKAPQLVLWVAVALVAVTTTWRCPHLKEPLGSHGGLGKLLCFKVVLLILP